MNSLWQDIRYGARMLLKQPGFTLVAVITLALGIGANTAIFSVVNGVLLRPLPFKDSERLMMVWNKGAEAAGGDRTPLAVADLLDWRAQNRSCDQFWRSHFGADTQVVGRMVNLNGASTTIIGVMPSQLNFPDQNVQLWRAIQWEQPTRRGPYDLTGVARLKPGVRIEQARADSKTMTTSFGRKNFRFNFLPVNDYIVGIVKPALVALLIAVTLVLLIAAVNVANLALVRAASRVKEISIRTALGASRGHIIRRLLTESLLLAIAGGAVGTLCAVWGVSLLVKFAPENLPRVDQIKIDGSVLLWTALVSLLTGVVCGLVPAWQSSRLNLNEVLRDGGRSTTESTGRRRGRSILVVAELALAVMLVTGAGLLIKSLWRLQKVDLGINPERVLTMQVALRGQRYEKPQQAQGFAARLVEQTRSLPGVRVAAVSNSLPPDETDFSSDFKIQGRTATANNGPQIAYFNKVSPEYFQALGILIRSGRSFTGSDSTDAQQVTLINEMFQRRFFPGEDPIGKLLNLGSEQEPDWYQIVGVVGDVKYNGVADDVQPALYLPAQQTAMWGISLVIKTDVADPLSVTAAVRNEIRKLDPDLPVTQVATMEQRLSKAISQPRFRTNLIALFAVVALILACVGIYGVISYSVSQRTHEIGIRMALGARTGDVLRMVVRQAIGLAVIGVALGLAASYALTSLMSTLLFGVKPTDPPTFIATAVLLGITALVASYLPARRATKINPLVALRYE